MDKIAWLSKLYYEIGKQQTDFRLSYSYTKGGETYFTKWISYLKAQENQETLKKFTHREQLKNEIILDLDKTNEEEYKRLIENLKKDDIKFYAYCTEDFRATHIHTFWKGLSLLSKLKREKIREKIISKYKCDISLKGDKHIMALEFSEHWKTGKVKKLYEQEKGINDVTPYIEEIEEEENANKETVGNSVYSLLIDNYVQNVEEFYKKQPFFYDDSCMFWFWKKIERKYMMVDDVDMMNALDKILGLEGQTVTSKVKGNYLEAFKRVGRKKIPKEAPKKWIQFKDNAISLKSGNIYNVTPDFFFTNPIPWSIGETEETPTMDKLIMEWVGEKYVQTAYEIIAYCCYADYPIHLVFCLVGCGRNGKSKFLGLINKFVGKENICSTELDVLLDSRFESFKLYKKLICTMGETNFGIISKTSLLKKLTGQDLIGFEFKNKKPFDDYNYAKIIISSNSLPTTADTSEGFFRRWLILDFPNIFPEGVNILDIIPEVEYNNLAKKVITMLPKLLKNSKFTNQGSIDERKKRYIMASNPLVYFMKVCCTMGDDEYSSYNELYTAYTTYLRKHKKRRVKMVEFKSALQDEGLWVEKSSKRAGDDWKSGYWVEGVGLKYDWKAHILDNSDIYDTIPTHSTHVGNEVGISVKLSQLSQKPAVVEQIEDIIHHHCSVCNANTSNHWDERGKPVCSDCYKAKMAQKGLE